MIDAIISHPIAPTGLQCALAEHARAKERAASTAVESLAEQIGDDDDQGAEIDDDAIADFHRLLAKLDDTGDDEQDAFSTPLNIDFD